MQNPFGFHSPYGRLYWLAWLILAVLYGFAITFVYKLDILHASVDAAVFALSYGAMGQIAWSVVKFSSLEKERLIGTIITHLAASVILVFIATSFAQTVLRFLFPGQEDFYLFNSQAYYIRVVTGLSLYSVVALIYYLIIYYEEFQHKKQRETEIENHLKVAELSMLKAQINPHFIFNSLNSVSSLTLTNPEGAHKMVIQLADFLRYSVGKSGEDMQSLESEIKAIELFLEIEKTRFGDRLTFEIDCDESCYETEIPALLLQPLIENAVKYGTHESTVPNNVRMHCKFEDNMLTIEIANHIERSIVVKKGKGIGLENVKARLNLVYGMNDLLETEKKDEEFIVKLRIPQNAKSSNN